MKETAKKGKAKNYEQANGQRGIHTHTHTRVYRYNLEQKAGS
jgi:hypothetical protein